MNPTPLWFPQRLVRPLAPLAVLVLFSAGCSNAPAGAEAGNNTAATAGAQTASTARTNSAATQQLASEGPTSTPASSGGGNAGTRDQAAKFAECMRANGVKAFPDPGASGTFTIDELANDAKLDTSSAAFKEAIAGCKDLEPPGFVGHTRTAEEQENALKFARCIRDNGVKDFPDPAPDEPLVDTHRIPSAAGNGGQGIPELNAAMQKCRDLAANAGAVGGQ